MQNELQLPPKCLNKYLYYMAIVKFNINNYPRARFYAEEGIELINKEDSDKNIRMISYLFELLAIINTYEEHFDEISRYPLVFAVSDFYAAEYIRFMQIKGKRVPEDISVIGFDGSPIGEYCVPALTTIRQDPDLRAKEAMKALEGLKKKEQIESPIVLPVELVERESVAEGKAQ